MGVAGLTWPYMGDSVVLCYVVSPPPVGLARQVLTGVQEKEQKHYFLKPSVRPGI